MIILDDKHISEFGFEVEPGHEDPITPLIEHQILAIPGRVGQWYFGSEIRERPFGFNLKIMNRFHDDMQSAYNKLVAFLFDAFGKPREVKIVREYEPDKFIKARVLQQMLPERLPEEGNLVLPFVAYDPYKYSIVYADEVTWGSEKITFESDYLLGHTNDFVGGSINITKPQTVNITVSGLAVQPVFEIDGTANNLKIECEGYSFSLPNFTNEKWEIDFQRYVVFRNGQETMIDLRNFYLMPGNNQIHVIGNNIDIELSVKFRDKYI